MSDSNGNGKRARSSSPQAGDYYHGGNKKLNRGEGNNGTSGDVRSSGSAAVASGKMEGNSAQYAGLPAAPSSAKTEDGQLKEEASGRDGAAASGSASLPASVEAVPTICIRALILTQEASIIIGKGGSHIKEIRERAGAKVSVSDHDPNEPDRVVYVTGPLDAVSKAFGLIVRKLNDEPFDQASLPGSRGITMKYLIPNHRMGSVIGKAGSKIKEIQEASGARLQASSEMLRGSTERTLSVTGVADAIHIAVYYVGTILQENADRPSTNIPYRPSGQAPGGYGQSSQYGGRPGGRGYGDSAPGGSYHGGPPSGYGYNSHPAGGMPPAVASRNPPPAASYSVPSTAAAPGSQTQQIYVPNDLVGNIIGKGGQKINEIRQMSGCNIKIMEPTEAQGSGANPNERLVTISGLPGNIQTAVQMLHARLESEKARKMQSSAY